MGSLEIILGFPKLAELMLKVVIFGLTGRLVN